MAERQRLRLVCVGAHPDDEIAAGGTLAKHARAGDEVTVLTMTRGGLGHTTLPTDELKRVRTAEGEAAARALGAQVRFLDFEDGAVPHTREAAGLLAELFRELKPHIVLTHGPEQKHPDHRATHFDVCDAFYLASLPLLPSAHPAHTVPELLFFAGEDADLFVDITETIDVKEQAMRAHKSQYEDWLVQHGAGVDRSAGLDLFREMRKRATLLGARSGCDYAEGFAYYFKPGKRALPLLTAGGG